MAQGGEDSGMRRAESEGRAREGWSVARMHEGATLVPSAICRSRVTGRWRTTPAGSLGRCPQCLDALNCIPSQVTHPTHPTQRTGA